MSAEPNPGAIAWIMDNGWSSRFSPLFFVLLVAVAYATVRQSTPLVWDDTLVLSYTTMENGGQLLPCEVSFQSALECAFGHDTLAGYRPLSTLVMYNLTRYFALGGSVFLWSLVVGGVTGSFLYALYRVGLRIIGDRRYAVLAVLLLACSSPFIAASWIIVRGLQVLVPLFICLGLLVYWHIRDSGWKSRLGYYLLILILFFGPWFREFIGLTAILVALLDLIERRRPTWITLICSLGLAHAIFPGWIVHQFIPTAPAKSVFQFGLLGSQVATNHTVSGGWFASLYEFKSRVVVGHFLCLLPSTIVLLMLAAAVFKPMASAVAWWQKGRPLGVIRLEPRTLLVWFTSAWWLGALLPLLKVFTEEVHLCYALVPFSLLAAVAVKYLVAAIRGTHAACRIARMVVAIFVAIGVGDQILNIPNSIRIVTGINRGIQQVADKVRETTPAGAIVIGNALHLEDIRLASGGHFISYWTVTAGIPYSTERAFMTAESLIDFMAEHDKSAIYFLDMDYDFTPNKRRYHSHRFVQDKDFEVQPLWSMSSIDIRYPFLDPLKNVTPREYTTVLFAPDLENDFYRGRAVDRSPFMREVYVHYTLYTVVGVNAKATVLTLQGESDDPLYSPQCLIDHDRFWEVSERHPQLLIASLNRPLTLQGVTLSSGSDEVERMPSRLTILGSQDGTNWQPVESLAIKGWRLSETRHCAVSCKTPFAQYKLSFDVPDPSKIVRLYGLDLSFVEAGVDRSVSSAFVTGQR